MGYFNEESMLSLPTADDLRLDLVDYADATASLLAEQRAAALERCGIEVVERDDWYVLLDGKTMMFRFDDDDAAYKFAYELASELIEQGDLH